jgi:predicted MFS family arabinose efflux permease
MSQAIPTSTSAAVTPRRAIFTPYQVFVVALLAFLQFTIVLDFMILSPLGAILLRDLGLSTGRFGFVVSVYAFSAGLSGLLAAGFADKFDRKRLLIFFYSGFVLGTLLCALATTYHFLLVARIVTGVFGGVVGSISFAIITDLFPFEVRGRVMGTVQTAFATSQVLGLPVGLWLATHWGWHAPFRLIVAVSLAVGVVIVLRLRPIDAHLKAARDRDPVAHLISTATRPRYLIGFSATMLLATGGFMLLPFGSAFTVHNLGVPLTRLPLVYMVTGAVSIIAGPLIGRLSDVWGKYTTFCLGTVAALLTVIAYTNLGPSPLWKVIAINSILFVFIMSRMISASALTSGVPAPADRGAYMSINSSLQQLSGGVASSIAGMIVVQAPSGRIEHYNVLGWVAAAAMTATMLLMFNVHRLVREKPGHA